MKYNHEDSLINTTNYAKKPCYQKQLRYVQTAIEVVQWLNV